MGKYSLIIKDYNERPCDIKDCKYLANQYRVTVIDKTAKVEKYCTRHQDTKDIEGTLQK